MKGSILAIWMVLALLLAITSGGRVLAAWQLVWNDEFEGTTLDTRKWDIEVNCWGGGNAEKQCYTSRAQNIFVSGGMLNLRPIAGTYTGSNSGCTLNNENSCTWTQPSTSGRVRTLNAVDGSWTYGRFEVRAKLPKGNFLWPAIWMLPTDNVYGTWAASGEIDIMEARGQAPREVSHAVHYGGVWPNNRYTASGDLVQPVDLTADFHIFALEWDSSALKFYVDDRLTHTQTLKMSFGSNYDHNGAPFDKKFHLLLNVAVAGGFFDPAKYGNFDINTAAPTWTQPMQIDYVRVYRQSDQAPVPSTPPVAPPTPISPPVSAPVTAPPSSGCNVLQLPLFPASDAHVDALYSSMMFGDQKMLQLRSAVSATSSKSAQGRYALLKFYLPKDRIPSRAILSLWGSLEEEAGGTTRVTVKGPLPNNNWSQDSVSFDSRASSGDVTCTGCLSASVNVGSIPTWATFDVLSIITDAINNGTDVVSLSVSLASAGSGHASFNALEAPSHKPILLLGY